VAQGEFVISEYPSGAVNGEGEVFSWTAARKTDTSPTLGGARAAPVGAWTTEGDLRLTRTDYNGALLPSFQVNGAVHKPFTWQGDWKDKWNFQGYALHEMDRFAAMCRRGNPVQLRYRTLVYWGIIRPWKFHYHHDAWIGYEFSLEVSTKEGEGAAWNRSPETQEQPGQALDDLNILAGSAAKAYSNKPAYATKTTVIGDTSSSLAQVSQRLNDLSNAVSSDSGVLKPISDAKNMALTFRALQGDCTRVLLSLVHARSDLDMGVRTAKGVLDFEAWSRNTSTLMRLIMGRSAKAADSMDARDAPKSKGIYRPFAGESLYSVSRKCFGTPNAWKEIMKANHLTTTVMTGNETLMIPDLGRV
jgi:hypothetical protein